MKRSLGVGFIVLAGVFTLGRLIASEAKMVTVQNITVKTMQKKAEITFLEDSSSTDGLRTPEKSSDTPLVAGLDLTDPVDNASFTLLTGMFHCSSSADPISVLLGTDGKIMELSRTSAR